MMALHRLFLPFATLLGVLASALAPVTYAAPAGADAARDRQDVPSFVDPLKPAASGGIVVVDRALARLSTHKRLLMIAAHPDDEDTFVLAHVSRALGGEAAYLSLTRGDGGQNLIGNELGEGLGLLRSRELEAARQVDGARQYFSRAFDFGYTRSLDETLQRWPEDVLMQDARAVARHFKPQVIVAVFPSDTRAGHGQHQASAVVAEKLFAELSAEPRSPWAARAFYRASWWNPTAADVTLDLGVLDPHTGLSTFQTALAGRSRHRCQDMGFEQPPGDAEAGLIRQAGPSGEDLFSGIDTRLAAIAAPLDGVVGLEDLFAEATGVLTDVEAEARHLRSSLAPSRLTETAEPMARILKELSALRRTVAARAAAEASGNSEAAERTTFVLNLLDEKLQVARQGLSAAAGIVVDAITDRDHLVDGEPLTVRTLFWSAAGIEVSDLTVDTQKDGSWHLVSEGPDEPEPSRFRTTVTDGRLLVLQPKAPVDGLGAPYFLRGPRRGDLYDWQLATDDEKRLPFEAPPLRLVFKGRIFGVDMAWTREVVQRYRDQALGEVRRPLGWALPLEVALDRHAALRRSDADGPLTLGVTLRRFAAQPLSGKLRAQVPTSWPEPPAVPFRIDGPPGSVQRLEIDIDVPGGASPGSYNISVLVDMDGGGSNLGRSNRRIEYEHIRPTALPQEARFQLQIADLELPDVRRVAYVRGASDRVPEFLADVGLPVEVLSADTLGDRDLSIYDAVIVGSRAFEIEPRLAQVSSRLVDFAYAGGTVLVQYQQYQYVAGGFAPFPLDIRRPHDRVTDETAPVRILAPGHPLLRIPNRITGDDWQGWVQERGLYFAGTWDEAWTPLLAMKDPVGDPGGDEKHGALLVAELGEGRYIYTGLAFFRQLPAGVVGAYRLFMNLIDPKAATP